MNLKNVMKDYFLDLDQASKDPNRLVAWCTSAGPAEILRAMGFEVFFPENHGALLGATRASQLTIPEANAYGYSPDICSYLTSDIGAYLKKITPLTKAYGIETVPKPDVLVYNTNQCKDVMHWFEFFSREYNAPVFGVHSPNHVPDVSAYHIENVVGQFKDLINLCERISGKPCKDENLKNSLELSSEATNLWREFLNLAKTKPSPFNFFDSTIEMGPIVVLRGTEIARDYYKSLLESTNAKIKDKHSTVPNEKLRIYWEGMPVWGRLRRQSEFFKMNNASVVASTYCNSWIFSTFDSESPLESMAKAYLEIFINRNDTYKESYIEKLVSEFEIDGVIFHDSRTCPNNSNSQYNLPNKLRAKGIPSVVIDGDLCDLRCYSDEQAESKMEAFLESIS